MKEIHLETVDSTNNYVKEHLDALEEMTFVRADYQTSGKGRNGRTWLAKKDDALMFSFALKNPALVSRFAYLSLLSGYAVALTLKDYHLKEVSVKWPNDAYVNGHKICGILLEGSLPEYLVIGIGVNVNTLKFENYPYRITPTSVALELGHKVDMNEFKDKLFTHIDTIFRSFIGKEETYMKEILAMDYLKDKVAVISSYHPEKAVHVIGMNRDCSLSIEDEGKIISLSSGEVNPIISTDDR